MYSLGSLAIIGSLVAASFVHADESLALSAELRTAASISAAVAESELNAETLGEVRALLLNHRGLVDLTGIEQFTGLESLELRGNAISDISVLSGLANLRYLDLSDNRVQDVTGLGELSQLRYLDISNNLVVSVEPLGKLGELATLNANNNAIEDLQPIGALKSLMDLRLASNRVRNLESIAPLTGLTRLDVENNHLASLNGIAGMKQLARLDITNNRVTSLAPLSSANQIRILRAEDNPIQDLAALAGVQRLEVLRLSTTKFDGNLAPLAKLSQLRALHFARSDIAVIDPLRNLTSLRWIDLSNNRIENAEPLVRVVISAETVDLRGNPLSADTRVNHLPKMRDKALFDGAVIAGIRPLFSQFAKLDMDRSGSLSHIETSILNPAISLEQFDVLDTDHSLDLTRAELYDYFRPAPRSLDVAWLARRDPTGYPEGTEESPFGTLEEAFAALKPNGTLMLFHDVELRVPKLTVPMRIVRAAPSKTPQPGEPVQQQTRGDAEPTEGQPTRVVTPTLRSQYPEPAPPAEAVDPEPTPTPAPAPAVAPPAPQ